MKKLFSILLSFAMVLGMGSVAIAEPSNKTPLPFSGEYPEQLTLKKVYDLPWEKGQAPIFDEMTFKITPIEVLERAGENPPAFSTLTITVPEGTGSVNFPEFTNVGTYVYKITEETPSIQTVGVTYNAPEMELKVTVVEKDNKFVVYQYAIRVGENGAKTKTDEAHNTYEASSLVITKQVTGNLGDKQKYFNVEVTFTKPEGTKIGGVISYGENETEKIQPDWKSDSVTATIQVKHDTTVTFENVPKGVTWEVKEDKEDYTVTYNGEGKDSIAGEITTSDDTEVNIVNKKDAEVDTGISLDSIPYILLLGFAVLGMGALFFRKRQNTSF